MKIMQTLTLTDNQKRVLAKIASAPTPRIAAGDVSRDQNIIAARDQLANLGAISYFDGNAELTDKGQQLAQDNGIVDETGELTPDGQQLATTSPEGESDVETAGEQKQQPELGNTLGTMGGAPGPQPGLESVQYEPMSLLKELIEW